jgi:Bcr/CflA subfamily drug resistance transporter
MNFMLSNAVSQENIMPKQQRFSWLFPIMLVLYEIAIYLSNDMYLPALPDMMRYLQLSATSTQSTVTMWFLGSASTPLIMGALSDRFGRRKILLIGGMIYVIATIFCALAIDQFTLFFSRVIQGAMIPSMMVAGYAAIHESHEHKNAVKILAIMGGISVLAPALGPLAGAVILIYASWQAIFWFIAIYALTMLVCLYQCMPETLHDDKRQPLKIHAIMRGYWLVLSNRNFLILMTIVGCTFAGFIAWITAAPLLVIEVYKFTQIDFGWIQAAVFAAYIAGSYFVNYLLKTHEAQELLNKGLLVTLMGGLLVLLTSVLVPNRFFLFLTAIIIFSFGSGVSFAPLNRLVIETSDQAMGIRVALFTTGLMACSVFGSAGASILYNGTSFSFGAIITFGAVFAYLLKRIYDNLLRFNTKTMSP